MASITKEVTVDVSLTVSDIAGLLEGLDADEFAEMLNDLGERMKGWGVGYAIMQYDFVGMSKEINEDGRFAARMIAKAADND